MIRNFLEVIAVLCFLFILPYKVFMEGLPEGSGPAAAIGTILIGIGCAISVIVQLFISAICLILLIW